MAGMERERMDLIALFMNEFSFLLDSALACRFISPASFRNRENTGTDPEPQESPRADRAMIIQKRASVRFGAIFPPSLLLARKGFGLWPSFADRLPSQDDTRPFAECPQPYFRDEMPGCSQAKIKSVIPGNILVISPISGAKPNPTILNQNSDPNSPGFVLVTWLNVASRCISA